MGSSVRSIFGRRPLNIPPPVVCLVHAIDIIDIILKIIPHDPVQENRFNPNGYTLTTFTIEFEWIRRPLSRTAFLKGAFWRSNLVPPQPIDPITGDPLPMPYPPVQEIQIDAFGTYQISTGTPRYDEVVALRVRSATVIKGHKYIDLGRLVNKE